MSAPESGEHPLCAGGALEAGALGEAVHVAGARVDALLAAPGGLLRTAAPGETYYGLGLALRVRASEPVRLQHCVFAAAGERPIAFSWVCIENRSAELLVLRYSELWDVPLQPSGWGEGACTARGADGLCVLADLESAIRGRAPEPYPEARGLSLDLQLAVPAGERRQLSFAYATPADEADAAALVRAWRGRVREELQAMLGRLRGRFGREADPLGAYRAAFGLRPPR